MVDMWPDNKKLIVENVAKDVTEVNKQKFENINTTIKSNPDQLEKVSKDSLSFLKEYLKADKNSAIALLYNTLKALKNTEKLERDDRKSLEKIRDMILTEEKICTREDVWAYQLKTEVFKETDTNFTAVKTYGETFQKWTIDDWYANITDKYTKWAYPKFDALFSTTGEFKDVYFTPEQLQTELYTKNNERIAKLKNSMEKFDIVGYINKNFAVTADDKIAILVPWSWMKLDFTTLSESEQKRGKEVLDEYFWDFNQTLIKAIQTDSWLDFSSAYEFAAYKKAILDGTRKMKIVTEYDKVVAEQAKINATEKSNFESIYSKTESNIQKKYSDKYTALKSTLFANNYSFRLNLKDNTNENAAIGIQETIYNYLKDEKYVNSPESAEEFKSKNTDDNGKFDGVFWPNTYKWISFINLGDTKKLSDYTYDTKTETWTAIVPTTTWDKTAKVDKPTTTSEDVTAKVNPTPEVNTTTETAPSATEIKNTLAAFDVSKVTVTLLSWVKPADYKTLFTAVSTKGTDAQVIAANAYMTALTTGKDPTLNGANTDKQPGILTFETICKALWQTDVYATVKARIDKVAADKAAAENTIKAPETLSLNKLDYKFTDNTKTKTLEVQWKNELMGDNYELLTFKYDATWILTSVQEPGHVAIPMPYAVNKTEVFTYGIVPVNRIKSAWFTSLVEPDQTYITISPVDGSIYQGILDNKARFKEWTRFLDNYGSYQSWIFNGPTLISGTNYNGKTGISKEIWTPAVNLANDFDIQPSKFDYIPARESTGTQWFQQQIDLKNKQFKS